MGGLIISISFNFLNLDLPYLFGVLTIDNSPIFLSALICYELSKFIMANLSRRWRACLETGKLASLAILVAAGIVLQILVSFSDFYLLNCWFSQCLFLIFNATVCIGIIISILLASPWVNSFTLPTPSWRKKRKRKRKRKDESIMHMQYCDICFHDHQISFSLASYSRHVLCTTTGGQC